MKKNAVSLALATVLLAAGGTAAAADCAVEIAGNDAMQFDKKEIAIDKSCKQFAVTVKHSGKLPKAAMGHNWVLARTADVQGIATDGAAAGMGSQYVKPGDARVIAHSKVVGPGESDTVAVPVARLTPGESYTFFCSFPGHWSIMKGALVRAR